MTNQFIIIIYAEEEKGDNYFYLCDCCDGEQRNKTCVKKVVCIYKAAIFWSSGTFWNPPPHMHAQHDRVDSLNWS